MNACLDDGATRRALLASGAAASAAFVAGGSLAEPHGREPLSPEARLRAYMLMRGALDERLVIGFISGRYHGVVDAEIKPLYGVVGATFARYRRRPDGAYEGATYEVPYFTDLETGVALDTFRNPYTGEVVDVVNSTIPPSSFVITRDLEIVAPRLPAGMTVRDQVIATSSSGPDLWMTEQIETAFSVSGQSGPFRYSEVTSLHALRLDIARPGVKSAPCQTAYTSVVSWRPWLRMGDHRGHLMGTGVGRYGMRFDELPETWRAATAHRRPDVLKDPGRPLEGLLPARFL